MNRVIRLRSGAQVSLGIESHRAKSDNNDKSQEILLKKWLQENKIFFEVGSAVCIGLASLCVSVFSWRTSEAQLKVAEAGFTPSIYARTTLLLDQSDQSYNDDRLEIVNSGGAVHNVRMTVATFIRVRLYDQAKPRFVYVPVNGYYSSEFSSTEPTGVLSTFTGHQNNKRFFDLFRASIGKGDESGVEIHLIKVVKADYVDHLGRSSKIYFVNSEVEDGGEAEPLLKTRNLFPILDIDRATLPEIVSRAKNDKRLYQSSIE